MFSQWLRDQNVFWILVDAICVFTNIICVMVPNDQNKVYSHIEDELNEEIFVGICLFTTNFRATFGCIQLQHIG
jgi:hypothetical protein